MTTVRMGTDFHQKYGGLILEVFSETLAPVQGIYAGSSSHGCACELHDVVFKIDGFLPPHHLGIPRSRSEEIDRATDTVVS